jgi:hypothetical protein
MGGGAPDAQMGPSNPIAGLQALAQMQQSPPPSGEQDALRDASMQIGFAASRIAQRSAKAARLLAEALAKIQSAREALESEGNRPLGQPPDLGAGPMAGGGQPPANPMAMGL